MGKKQAITQMSRTLGEQKKAGGGGEGEGTEEQQDGGIFQENQQREHKGDEKREVNGISKARQESFIRGI